MQAAGIVSQLYSAPGNVVMQYLSIITSEVCTKVEPLHSTSIIQQQPGIASQLQQSIIKYHTLTENPRSIGFNDTVTTNYQE